MALAERDEVLEKSGVLENEDEIIQEMVNEGKMALPDAYQKYEILKTWTAVFDVMAEADGKSAFNAGNKDNIDVYKYKVVVQKFFCMIRCMIVEKYPKLVKPGYKPTTEEAKFDLAMYNRLRNMPFSEQTYGWAELVRMMYWLDDKSHDLGITNLLMMPKNPFDEIN